MKKIFLMAMMASPLSAQTSSDVVSDTSVTKIAFGSCRDSRDKDQSMLEVVLKYKPDVFIFLGDNIYGDTADMELLKKKYAVLGNEPGFQKVRAQTKVLATWDDHDYGINDGGNSYSMRQESQQVFLDFFDEPKDSVRRTRPGIYTSYSFGSKGKTVQIILLDTRYFRDVLPIFKGKKKPGTVGWYEQTTDTSKTLLGAEQWLWLEKQLQVKADVRILASSIQMLSYEKGMENWGQTPHEQKRLFSLLEKYQANKTVAISGDVHFAELSKVMIGDYPLYDLTSSGLTHTSKGWSQAKNSFRVGKSHWEINAGLIEIDLKKSSLTLNIINKAGKKLIEHHLPFSDLVFPSK